MGLVLRVQKPLHCSSRLHRGREGSHMCCHWRGGACLLRSESVCPVCLALGLLQEGCREATKSSCGGVSSSFLSVRTYQLLVLELLSIAPGAPEETGQLQSSNASSNDSCCATVLACAWPCAMPVQLSCLTALQGSSLVQNLRQGEESTVRVQPLSTASRAPALL